MVLLDRIIKQLPEDLLKYPKGKYFDYSKFSTDLPEDFEILGNYVEDNNKIIINKDSKIFIRKGFYKDILISNTSRLSVDISDEGSCIAIIQFKYDTDVKLDIKGGKFLVVLNNLPKKLRLNIVGGYGSLILNTQLEKGTYSIIGKALALDNNSYVEIIGDVVHKEEAMSSINISGLSFGYLSVRIRNKLLGSNSCSKTNISIFNFNRTSALPLLDIRTGIVKCAEHKSAVYNINEKVYDYIIHKGLSKDMFKKVLLKDFLNS